LVIDGRGRSRRLRAALAADTASIAVMELADNTVIAAIPGAMDVGLDTALFWASLAFSLSVAFIATVPLNRWLIGHSKGHAPGSSRSAWARSCWPRPAAVPQGELEREDLL
jgi:Domain of unknown function (DUF4396)